MFWRKKRSKDKPIISDLSYSIVNRGLIEALTSTVHKVESRLKKLEQLLSNFKKYNTQTPEYRLEALESDMALWNKRMRYLARLLDGETILDCGHDVCCELFANSPFDLIQFCPKCGNFIGDMRSKLNAFCDDDTCFKE